MKNNLRRTCVWLGLSVLVTGCAVETGNETAKVDPTGELSNEETIESLVLVETPTDKVEFLDFSQDGEPRVGLSVSSLIAAGKTPVQKRVAEGNITNLELFLALSEEEPPPVLVAAHALEAHELGRADESIVDANIGTVEFVDKVAPWACTNLLLGEMLRWGHTAISSVLHEDNVSTNLLSWTAHLSPQTRLYSTTCNDGNVAVITHHYVAAAGYGNVLLFSRLISPGWVNWARYAFHPTNGADVVVYGMSTVKSNEPGTVRYHRRLFTY